MERCRGCGVCVCWHVWWDLSKVVCNAARIPLRRDELKRHLLQIGISSRSRGGEGGGSRRAEHRADPPWRMTEGEIWIHSAAVFELLCCPLSGLSTVCKQPCLCLCTWGCRWTIALLTLAKWRLHPSFTGFSSLTSSDGGMEERSLISDLLVLLLPGLSPFESSPDPLYSPQKHQHAGFLYGFFCYFFPNKTLCSRFQSHFVSVKAAISFSERLKNAQESFNCSSPVGVSANACRLAFKHSGKEFWQWFDRKFGSENIIMIFFKNLMLMSNLILTHCSQETTEIYMNLKIVPLATNRGR